MDTPESLSMNYNEYLAYLLLYAAHADFIVQEEELAIITALVGKPEFDHIAKAFENENDEGRLEVILQGKKQHIDPLADKSIILQHLKDIFIADNEYQAVEKEMFLYLRKLLEL
jgi:hypothetical protein